MAKNNRLEYLSILHSFAEGHVDYFDQELSDADDGEGCQVAKAKLEALFDVDGMIKNWTELRDDIKKLSLVELQKKY